MTFGNKLLFVLVIVTTQIQFCVIHAALCKTNSQTDNSAFQWGKLRVDIRATQEDCIPIDDEQDDEAECSQAYQQPALSQQELKNKVSEEQLTKTTAEVCAPTSQDTSESQCVAQVLAQKSEPKLFFKNPDVQSSLDVRSITYDGEYEVTLNDGQASCPLTRCNTVKIQQDGEGRNYFLPRKGTKKVQIINPKITQITMIGAKVRKLWIEVYLGYNPELLGTFVDEEKKKRYNASILLVQSNSLPQYPQIIVQRFPSPKDACPLRGDASSQKTTDKTKNT